MLPQKIDYTFDLAHENLPTPRVAWRIDAGRSALLVHDMQAYFARIYAEECAAFNQAVAQIAALLDAARAAGVPVFYTAQPGDQDPLDRGLLTDMWGRGIRAEEEQTKILDALAPAAGERVLVKHRYSAFARSDFAEQLAAVGRDQLVITGIYAHIGVAATAVEAFMRDIETFVVADAVADFSHADHQRALQSVARTCAMVPTTEQVVAAFAPNQHESTGAHENAGAQESAAERALRADLAELLDAEVAALALAEPERDLFELGLDSLRAFELLDRLAERGTEIDYADFVRRANVSHLLQTTNMAGVG